MTLDDLKARLDMLKTAEAQSAANHNALLGRIAECTNLIEEEEKKQREDNVVPLEAA